MSIEIPIYEEKGIIDEERGEKLEKNRSVDIDLVRGKGDEELESF